MRTVEQSYYIRHSEVRNQIAQQLRNVRNLERSGVYMTNRGASEYVSGFLGLQHFFDYVRTLPRGTTVLDLGAGLSIGTQELSSSVIGKDLSFISVGLTRDFRVNDYIGSDKYKITSAEKLRGIANESVKGIIALHSIAYSEAPEMVIDRINKVLIPGGVIKATFCNETFKDNNDFLARSKFKSHDRFSAQMRSLGYDTAYHKREGYTILLALKPGVESVMTARNLLDADRLHYYSFDEKLKRLKRTIKNKGYTHAIRDEISYAKKQIKQYS